MGIYYCFYRVFNHMLHTVINSLQNVCVRIVSLVNGMRVRVLMANSLILYTIYMCIYILIYSLNLQCEKIVKRGVLKGRKSKKEKKDSNLNECISEQRSKSLKTSSACNLRSISIFFFPNHGSRAY